MSLCITSISSRVYSLKINNNGLYRWVELEFSGITPPLKCILDIVLEVVLVRDVPIDARWYCSRLNECSAIFCNISNTSLVSYILTDTGAPFGLYKEVSLGAIDILLSSIVTVLLVTNSLVASAISLAVNVSHSQFSR